MPLLKQLIEFESMAAKKKLDKESSFYLDVLDKALQDEDNKNIAITGGYGAGKTTIIDSYFQENNNKTKKMMRISIATFQSDKDVSSDPSFDHNLLEQQILQQMFFQVPPNKILNSKFTKISDLPFRYTFGILLYLLLVTVATILIVRNKWLDEYYSSVNNVVDFLVVNWLWVLMVGILIVFNAISLWLLFTFFRKLGVSKFGIANTTIEFNFKDGSTVFNHYLDEIIYLFKKTDYKYIVFEDLDRFQDVQIFERLRGLNTTLNRSAHMAGRDIKFIYALKDDIFTGDDETESIYNRTKFFDFIIPTVKVMHSSTAESILLKKLGNFISNNKNEDIGNQRISKVLIEDIALFINDMRTLINICNEFEIFRLRLQKSSVTYDNLFAFIVYKNIYPSDYSDLIENKGLVFDVFNKKNKLVKTLENKISDLKTKHTNGIGSIITDKKDIAMLFAKKKNLDKIQIKQANILLFSTPNYVSGGRRYIEEGTKTLDYFLNNDVVGDFTLYRNGNAVEKYSNVEEFFTINSINYLELYNTFEDQVNQKKEKIESQINKLLKQIQHVETKSVSRLMREDKINLHVNLENKKLLYLLIRNNWLNETYEEYLTVFREGSISIKDNNFIQTIKIGDTISNLNLPLKNKEKVAEKVRVDDISSVAVLNIDLITTLLKKDTGINNGKLNKIISILFQELEENLDDFLIIIQRLKEESSFENLVWKFIKTAQQTGIEIWNSIENTTASKEQKEEYVIAFLEYSDINELELKDEDRNRLQKFIASTMDVGKIVNSDNLFNLLDAFKIKFTSISNISDESILDSIIKINGYEINLINMRKILEVENISIQEMKKNEHMSEYIFQADNLEPFIKNVLLEQEVYNEEESVFIEFIESLIGKEYEIDELIIQSIVQHWSGIIIDLTQVDYIRVIKILADENKFNLTWENIIYCSDSIKAKEEKFDIAQLLSTENSWVELIANSQREVQETYFKSNEYQSFVNQIFNLNPINHPKIEEFISKLNYPVDLQEVPEKDNKLFEILIDHKVLSWNIDIYDLVGSEQYKIDYVKENIDDAMEELPTLINDETLVWSIDLFKLMNESDEIETELKEKYFLDNLLQIKYQEFKFIVDNYNLEFNNQVIQSLVNQADKDDILILYLIEQWRLEFTYEVSNIIDEYDLPWNNELFQVLLEDSLNVAADYLLKHIDKIEEIDVEQKLFENLIVKVDNNKFIELISKYQNEIDISTRVSNQLYDILLSIDDPDMLLNKLSQQTVFKVMEKIPLKNSSKFLYQYLVLENFDREQIFTILSRLNEPFKLIKLKGRQIRIMENHTNIEKLLDFLVSKDLKVISSYDPVEQGYVVNNKRV